MLFLRNVFAHLEDISAKKLPLTFECGWKVLLLISRKKKHIYIYTCPAIPGHLCKQNAQS